MNDVARQGHYMGLGVQPIELLLANYSPEVVRGTLEWTAIQYVMRADMKNGAEDIAKAIQLLTWSEEFRRTGKVTLPGKEG